MVCKRCKGKGRLLIACTPNGGKLYGDCSCTEKVMVSSKADNDILDIFGQVASELGKASLEEVKAQVAGSAVKLLADLGREGLQAAGLNLPTGAVVDQVLATLTASVLRAACLYLTGDVEGAGVGGALVKQISAASGHALVGLSRENTRLLVEKVLPAVLPKLKDLALMGAQMTALPEGEVAGE